MAWTFWCHPHRLRRNVWDFPNTKRWWHGKEVSQCYAPIAYLAHPMPQLTRPITWNLPLIGRTSGLPLSPWVRIWIKTILGSRFSLLDNCLFPRFHNPHIRNFLDKFVPFWNIRSLASSFLNIVRFAHLWAAWNHDWHFSAEITWTFTSWKK